MARVYLGVWYIIGGHLTVNTYTYRHLDGESILGGLVYNWGSSHSKHILTATLMARVYLGVWYIIGGYLTINTHTCRHLDGESILGGLVYNWGSSHSQHSYLPPP